MCRWQSIWRLVLSDQVSMPRGVAFVAVLDLVRQPLTGCIVPSIQRIRLASRQRPMPLQVGAVAVNPSGYV